MQVRVTHTIDDLASDLRRVATSGTTDCAEVVRDNIRTGAQLARANARRTSGAHGKHYPNAITSEMTAATVGEFGPDSGKPQGGMSFENGSRNQRPHRDLARAADALAPDFHRDVEKMLDGWFWPA